MTPNWRHCGGALLVAMTAGCADSLPPPANDPPVAYRYEPPAMEREQPFTVKTELDPHGVPYTARVLSESPYPAQQPQAVPKSESDSSFTQGLEAAGLVVGGTDLAKLALRRPPNVGTAEVAKPVMPPEVATGTAVRTGAAETNVVADTAATRTTAARTVAGTTEIEPGTAARTLGRALAPAESDALGLELRALGRTLFWLGEECVLVFCR